MKIRLSEIAHARSGDKGDISNVGLIANQSRHYPLLAREVTTERVKRHFGSSRSGQRNALRIAEFKRLEFRHGAGA